jgi:hypothetical protein
VEIEEAIKRAKNQVPFDERKHLEAGLCLVNNRNKFTDPVFYKVVPRAERTFAADEQWRLIKQASSGERCPRGYRRIIWPTHIRAFKEGQIVTLHEGQQVFILPAQYHYEHAEKMLEIVKGLNDVFYVQIIGRPFAGLSLADFLDPKGLKLMDILKMLETQAEPIPLMTSIPKSVQTDAEGMAILTIKAVTEDSLTICVDAGYIASGDPSKDGISPIDTDVKAKDEGPAIPR